MTLRRQWNLLGALTGLYLIGLGLLAGVISERFRFDSLRSGILRQFDDATRRASAHAMAGEHEVQAATPPAATPATEVANRPKTWATHLEVVDAALARRDVHAAERAWREAHAAALRTRAWRPLVDVGDAALRIGAVAGHRQGSVSRARELYMAALIRARADRSAEGVLHVAESFQALGDHAVVEQCLIIAETLGASHDSDAVVRLRALSHRALDVRATPRIEP